MAKLTYRESRPAACESGVTCRKCGEDVVVITFSPSGDVGVCACPWTSWWFDRLGYGQFAVGTEKILRSTPLGYEGE